ncbi:MAG: filamentous hemagglutinin N-terminal domain-containing protein, partial [Candidatus Omnitrophica bacterium]|nr:filamentous hemagglutinin N-terminal domain-containing protein [Candidatus Omnitrophota bacterium]
MTRKIISMFVVVLFVLMSAMPPCGYAQVLPEGGNFVNGNGTITVNGQTMNIDQMSSQAIIEWLSFCISQGYTVNINQPGASSVSLNRVIGADPSVIMGNLLSNGQVFLVNPNGVLFGASSYVNAPGVVASTLNISNSDFLNGNYTFLGQGGSVVNQGLMLAPGGYVTLLGNNVANNGTIVSELGTVTLAAGEKITMSLDPLGLVSVVIDEALTQNTTNATDAVVNTGSISADGGRVVLTADSLNGLFTNVVNNEGIIEAKGLVGNNGEVILLAKGEDSLGVNTGTIDVSAKEAGAEGGFVELSGETIDYLDGTINTGGGQLLFDPVDFILGDADEAWLQTQTGSVNIASINDIIFNLGDLGGDDILNLFNFTSGKTFSLSAARHIDLDNDSIVTAGGDIELYSNALGLFIGDIFLGTGAGLNSNGGDILLSGYDVHLTSLINAGTGDVEFATINGIDDEHTGLDIIADNLTVNSHYFAGSQGEFIDTDVNSLDVNTTFHIRIDNTAAGNTPLTITNAVSSGQFVEIVTNGDMIANNVYAAKDVELISQAGNIDARRIYAGDDAELHAVTVTSLPTSNPGSIANVTADTLKIYAQNGVGLNAPAGLTTDVNDLYVLNSTGGIRITDILGDLNVVSVHNQSTGDVEISSDGDMNLGYVYASAVNPGYNAILTSNNGGIVDANGSLWNVNSDGVSLNAATGVGTADAIEIHADSLSATNTTSGDIVVEDLSGDLDVVQVINNAVGGDADITSANTMNVNKINSHNVLLHANEITALPVSTPGAHITANVLKLYSQDGIGQNTAAGITTDVDNLYAINSTGGIRITDIAGDVNVKNINSTTTGDVELTSDGDMNLNYVYASAANPGYSATLTSNNGAIVDDNGSLWNVNADNVSLNAATGIGSGDAIEIHADNLSALNSTSGKIAVRDLSGDLTVNSVVNNASNGNVNLRTSGTMNVGTVQSGKKVTLRAAQIDALSVVPGTANITAKVLKLYSQSGIGQNTPAGLLTDVNDLYALNFTNGIRVTDILGDLNVVNVNNSTAGDIKITSDGDMNLNYVYASAANPGYSATLTSNNGAIVDDNGSLWNVNSDSISLNAATGIGSSDAIEIHADNLSASNSTSGDIVVEDLSGDLNVNSVVNSHASGNVDLTTSGTMSIGSIASGDQVDIHAVQIDALPVVVPGTANITADVLKLYSQTGIGQNTPAGLLTDVNDLYALNFTNGIRVTDILGDLNVVNVNNSTAG